MELTEEIKEELLQCGWALEKYPELQNNKEAVLIAVTEEGMALQYASDELKDDDQVVMIAIRTSGFHIIRYASPRIQNYFD